MTLQIIAKKNPNTITMKLDKNGRVLDPVREAKLRIGSSKHKQAISPTLSNGVDSESFLYYHNLEDQLTPLEATGFKKRGFITRNGTLIFKELLTGLITVLDKILERNNIDTSTLNSFKTRSELGEHSTSHKILLVFVKGLKIKI
jgi:hypothetical protein